MVSKVEIVEKYKLLEDKFIVIRQKRTTSHWRDGKKSTYVYILLKVEDILSDDYHIIEKPANCEYTYPSDGCDELCGEDDHWCRVGDVGRYKALGWRKFFP